MMLLSISPGTPCRVNAYRCTTGFLVRRFARLVTTRFSRTPEPLEVAEMLHDPAGFVSTIGPEAA